MESTAARGRAYARMALVGNPSDRSGGAVLAACITGFAATVTVGIEGDDLGATDLITAAKEAFPAPVPADLPISCETSIPRQVGLGGSSAIVIATLRALAEHQGVRLEANELAETAWAAERDVMGQACGPQDRYAQAHEGLVFMDFAEGAQVRRLDPEALPPLYLAYLTGGAAPSSVTHSELDERADELEDEFSELADLARHAARRLEAGEGDALGPLMDATFDVRARMLRPDPVHAGLIEIARAHGASANYTGSGGAIAGRAPIGVAWQGMRTALEAEGCALLRPSVAG